MTLPFSAETAACRAAQIEWSKRSVAKRLQPIRELRHLLVERADEVCDVVASEIGRPAVEVVATELLPTAAALKFLERDSARILRPREVGWRPLWLMGSRDEVHHRPWGVVGIIGTWNYPVYLNLVQMAYAAAAGNAVLWKPSEVAPRTAALTHRLFLDAGFPPALLQMLPATREGGAQLAEADIDHVVFTGSDAVGRKLAARLGERLIPSTLELSGIDAMFVLEDADLDMAVKAMWFGMTLNHGQTCIAVRRVFVQRNAVHSFMSKLFASFRSLRQRKLVTPAQAEQTRRILQDADNRKLAHNAMIPIGMEGSTDPGFAARLATLKYDGELPSVIIPGETEMAICNEPICSPLATLIPFYTIDNAVSLAAECPFGLSSSIFTKDIAKAKELASRIRAGSVVINDVLAPTGHPGTPFGGRGSSGWGVTQGPEGLLAMTVPQVVTVRNGRFRPHFDEAAKPDPATLPILSGLLKATHARGIRARLSGVRELFRGIRRKK